MIPIIILAIENDDDMLGDDIDQFGDDCPALDEYFFKEEDLMRLAAVWPLLDEKTRYLLNGKYVLKKSAKELADDLKMPPDNIRMALVRAKRKARKAMADMAPA